MIDMENLTVPIGLTPKVKKGEVPDLKGIVMQEYNMHLWHDTIIFLRKKRI